MLMATLIGRERLSGSAKRKQLKQSPFVDHVHKIQPAIAPRFVTVTGIHTVYTICTNVSSQREKKKTV